MDKYYIYSCGYIFVLDTYFYSNNLIMVSKNVSNYLFFKLKEAFLYLFNLLLQALRGESTLSTVLSIFLHNYFFFIISSLSNGNMEFYDQKKK